MVCHCNGVDASNRDTSEGGSENELYIIEMEMELRFALPLAVW